MNFFTKTKTLIAIIIVLSAIILAVFGTMGYHYLRHEQEFKNRRGENNQGGKYMAKQLQLTPDQINQFDSLRECFHKESNGLIKASRDISKDIMEEITSEKPDTAKLKALAVKFGKLQEQQKQMMINHLLEVKGKCTPAQHVNFKKLIQQMEPPEQKRRDHNPNDRVR